MLLMTRVRTSPVDCDSARLMRVAFGLYVLRVHVCFAMFRPARSEITEIIITLYTASYPSEDPAQTFIHPAR